MTIMINCRGIYTPGGDEERDIAYLDVEYNGNIYDWLIYIPQGANLGDHIESSKTKIQQDIDAKELEWSNHPKVKYEQDLMNPGVTIEVQVSKEEVVKPNYPDYYALRRNEYPEIGDQLDALWKGVDSAEFANVMNKIQEVKQKYPKA
jgi:hypothetical protein